MATTQRNTLSWANPQVPKQFSLTKTPVKLDTDFKNAQDAVALTAKADQQRTELVLKQLEYKEKLKDSDVRLLAQFGGKLAEAKIEGHEFNKLAKKVELALGDGEALKGEDTKDLTTFSSKVISPVFDLVSAQFEAKGDPKSALKALEMDDQGARNKALSHILDHTSKEIYEKAYDMEFEINGQKWSLKTAPKGSDIERQILRRIESTVVASIVKGGQFTKNEILQNYMIPAYEKIEKRINENKIASSAEAAEKIRNKREQNFIDNANTPGVNTALSRELEIQRQTNVTRLENGKQKVNLADVLTSRLDVIADLVTDRTLTPGKALNLVNRSGSVTIGDKTYPTIADAPDFKRIIRGFKKKIHDIQSEQINFHNRDIEAAKNDLSKEIELAITSYKGKDVNIKIIAPFLERLEKAGPTVNGIPTALGISDLSDRAQKLIKFGLDDSEEIMKYLFLRERIEAGHVINEDAWQGLPPWAQKRLEDLNNKTVPNTTQQRNIIDSVLMETILDTKFLRAFKLNPGEKKNLQIEARAWIFREFNKQLEENKNPKDSMQAAIAGFNDYFAKNFKDPDDAEKLVKQWAKAGVFEGNESDYNLLKRLNDESKYISDLEKKTKDKDLTELLRTDKPGPGETVPVTNQLKAWIDNGGMGPPPVWYIRMSDALGGRFADNPGIVALERANALGLGDPKKREKIAKVITTLTPSLRALNSNKTTLNQVQLKEGEIPEDVDKQCMSPTARVLENPYDYVDTRSGKPLQIGGKDVNLSDLNLSQINDILRSGDTVRGWGAYNIKSSQLLNLFRLKDFQKYIGLINPDVNPDETADPILFNKDTQLKIRNYLIKTKAWTKQSCNGSFLQGYRPVFHNEETIVGLGIDLDPTHPNHPSNISPRLFEATYLNK